MDYDTLNDYRKGNTVDWDTVKRRLLLNEREENYHIPDNIYDSAANWILGQGRGNIGYLADFLSAGLYRIADEFLFEEQSFDNKGIIYVHSDKFSEWQNLITYVPPLVLLSARLAKDHQLSSFVGAKQIFDYINDHVICNSSCTAIVPPFIPELGKLASLKGLNDLHIHLNGSFEIDSLWEYALDNPSAVCKSIFENLNNESVLKLLAQEHLESGVDLLMYLRQARALRNFIVYELLFSHNDSEPPSDYPYRESSINKYYSYSIKNFHPLYQALLGDAVTSMGTLSMRSMECMMYVMIISRLSSSTDNNRSLLAKAFHHYLLILGLVNRFAVHQYCQNGFQQFQMISEADVRHELERTEYVNRFKQLNGNYQYRHNLGILECRFSIKNTPNENKALIDKINSGWNQLGYHCSGARMSLVGHFIKIKDTSLDNAGEFLCRNYQLRRQVWQKANAVRCINEDNDIRHKIRGIDAAGSEFNAPPEVFAPAYRYLRRCGVKRATYHVGEDFNHLISGIRAVYEAVNFLNLRNSDRIGHGVALGIDPLLWRKRIGDTIYIGRGEWFDDLVFVYHLLSEQLDSSSNPRIYALLLKVEAQVKQMISELNPSRQSSSNISDYVCAWLNRCWDPMMFFSRDYTDAQKYDFTIEEWEGIRSAKKTISEGAADILWRYHYDSDFKKKYNESIRISLNVEDFLGNEDLRIIQDIVCRVVREKGIVIEVLPTSNIRIGYYDNMHEHHLMRWLNEGMTLVLGSDDPGIFMTNIYNEYGHVYNIIKNHKDNATALNEIARLNRNGYYYSF